MVAGDTHRSQGALLKPKPQLIMKDSYKNTRNGSYLLLKMWPFLVCFSRYCRKKALLQEKYSSNMHANDLKVWDSLEATAMGNQAQKWLSLCLLVAMTELLIIWCVCFPFFFILIVDIPEIHGGEGYEDEIDGGYHYDLTDNHEIQLLLKTSIKNNVLAIGRAEFRTISQKYKWKEPRGEQRNH